jgi:hypothetical protein
MAKCFRQRSSSRGPRGSRKAGYVVKSGNCYQVRKYRRCAKKRAVAMHQGVAVVAPCGMPMSQALKDRAWNTYKQANWSLCARRNAGVKDAKKAKCRVIFFKKGGQPIMRGKTANASLKAQGKRRWAKRSEAFKKKFAKGGFRRG